MNPPGLRRPSAELKHFDQNTAATVVAAQTTAVVTQMFTPDEGTGNDNHVGNRVQIKSLQYMWEGSFAATTAGNSALRLCIIYDRQPNAATPATTTVFVTDTITGFREPDQSERFITLVDEIIPCVALNGPSAWCIKGYRKLNLPAKYNDVNNGTIGDVVTGSIIAFTWQDGNIITAAPTNRLRTRVGFVDV